MKLNVFLALLLLVVMGCGCCKLETKKIQEKWQQEGFVSKTCYECVNKEKALLTFENVKGTIQKQQGGFFIGRRYYVNIDKNQIPVLKDMKLNVFSENDFYQLFPLQTLYGDEDVGKKVTISGTLYRCYPDTDFNILTYVLTFTNSKK